MMNSASDAQTAATHVRRLSNLTEALSERLEAVRTEVHDWKTRAGLLKWVGGGVVGCIAFITGEVRSWWNFFGGS